MKISRSELWCVFFGTLLGGFLLYARTFQYTWTYDDFMVIVNNPDVHSFWGFVQDSYPGRPLRELTFLLDYTLWGMNPVGWHLQNIIWHSLAAFLLFLLLRNLGGGRCLSWLTTVIFLFHPLCVEVVASISHRKDSLAIVFCLLSFLCFQKASIKSTKLWLWRVASFSFFVIALYAKQTAIGLIPVLLVYEWQFLPVKKRFLFRFPRAVLGILTLAGVFFLVWFFFFDGILDYRKAAESLLVKLEYYQDAELATYFRTLIKAWVFMAVRVFFPHDLAVEYIFSAPQQWLDPWVLSGVFLGVCCLVGGWLLRRSPLGMLGFAWIFCFAGATSNLWPLAYWAADRYLYAPLIGFALLFSLALERWVLSARLKVALTFFVPTSLFIVAWLQVPVWQSDETVHLHALKVSPNSSYIMNELGKYYEKNSADHLALNYYRRATKANEFNAAAHYNLGQMLERSGAIRDALNHYRMFLNHSSKVYHEAEMALRDRIERQYGIRLVRYNNDVEE